MSKRLNYIGMRSGRLVVTGIHHKTKTNHIYVTCKCDCGKEVVVRGHSIVSGKTKSCGCFAKEYNIERNIKHGMFGTRIYNIWAGLRRRCYDSKVYAYKRYGGRGIDYLKDWDNFTVFYDWAIKNGYRDDLTIDRIDNDKGYFPQNCRWVSIKENSRNKSSNKFLEYNGERHTYSEWAERLGINYETLLTRIRNGYPVEEVLFHKKYTQYNKRRKK